MMREKRASSPKTTVRHKGFSLLEVTISALIMGIVAAITIPTYTRSVQRYRAQVAVQRLAQDIELCRRHARFTSQNVTLTIALVENSYRIWPLESPLRPGSDYEVIVGSGPGDAMLRPVIDGRVAREENLSAQNITIVFDRYGVPNQSAEIGVSCGVSEAIVRLSAEGTVTKS